MGGTAEFIQPHWPAPAGVLALSTTRPGGVSQAPYDSFNVGDHVGDDPERVRANRQLLEQQLPPGTQLPWLEQVHGTTVVRAQDVAPGTRADAVWTDRPGHACVIMTADCLPVLFCSQKGGCVGAAHAGWRGLLGGVLEATIDAMPAPPGQLFAWLGPAIGPTAFEVGAEVRQQFLEACQPNEEVVTQDCFRPGSDGRYLADLYSLARLRLARRGVSRVFGADSCTFSAPQHFYSYRRDGETGRMASLVMLDHS